MKTKCTHVIPLLFFFLVGFNLPSFAILDTIPKGSYLINMGITPQTIGNGLKPYGLIFDMIKNFKVPVKLVINPSKLKDGIDFTHNGINYSGGTYIIAFEFRTTAVNTAISNWQAQGVVGRTSVSDIIIDVFATLRHPPIWTLDKTNGALVVPYFQNAGILAGAYGGSTSAGWKDPSQLGNCDDIFVLPHADPTWATHNNLYYWNRDFQGTIWSGCHAVSVLESITDPGNTIQLNFLSTTGLVNYKLHADGSPPYQYNYPADQIMQFMQTLDNVVANGSEQIFMPNLGGGWRPSTKVGVYDPSHVEVPSVSPGPASVLLYGRAYGDASRGWVMYEAGHEHNTTSVVPERVAAQRAFFNFSYFSTSDKNASYSFKMPDIPAIIVPNQQIQVSFSVPPTLNLTNYTIKWTSSGGGTFSPSANQQTVTFTAPNTFGAIIISVTLTNPCGRQVFESQGTYVTTILPASTNLTGLYNNSSNSISLNWAGSYNGSIQHYEIEKSENGVDFASIGSVNGQINPTLGMYGFNDPKPFQGVAFYRLNIVYEGGLNAQTAMVKINTGEPVSKIRILSNPVKGEIAFRYYSGMNDEITYRLVDIEGRVLASEVKTMNGATDISIKNSSSVSPGIYFLQIKNKNKNTQETIKLVK